MKFDRLCVVLALAAAFLTGKVSLRGDESVVPDEMNTKARWVQGALLSLDQPVVSFLYNGTPSGALLPGWKRSPASSESLPGGRTRHRLSWTDPATGLEVRIVALEYGDYPAVEWTAYLKNSGAKATPIIEQVRGIDVGFGGTLGSKECTLRTTQGDTYSASSYEPLAFKLSPRARSFQPTGGRSTNGAWPFFNLDGGGDGVIVALGWPGQWQANFSQGKDAVIVRGGQETTHVILQPGEEIRTPLTAVLFWAGEDWTAGQNLWRHWFLAHNIPRPYGKLPPPDTSLCMPELDTSATGEIAFLNEYLSHGNKIDYLWIDAGWYEMNETTKLWYAAKGLGTWKPDATRYPHGIREVSDYVHGKGMKLILWFEPERVYRGSFLWDHHPEWLLKWNGVDDNRLLNLGNPAARQWLTDYISRFITDQGVDLYRQDFNVDPLEAWESNDSPDRQGMTENLYVQGYLAYWDALREQHPNMLIDSCASGGRRNDLETLRRSVPLLRSDYQAPNMPDNDDMSTDVFDGNQGHTYGLSFWVPFFGTGEYSEDAYSARSHLCPAMGVGTHLENPDWKAFARQLSDQHAVGRYFYGDYFPLTPYSKSEKVWMAWEFLRPAEGDGVVQAFRREDSPDVGVDLKLHGLKPSATYECTNLDSGGTIRTIGGELMAKGLHLEAAAPRTALIVTFKEIP